MWIRYRFYTKADDYRPVIFNPEYPWWKTGETADDDPATVIVAYLPAVGDPVDELVKQWPEAFGIDYEKRDKIEFSERFPEPEYYKKRKRELLESALGFLRSVSVDTGGAYLYLRQYFEQEVDLPLLEWAEREGKMIEQVSSLKKAQEQLTSYYSILNSASDGKGTDQETDQ